ncbi:S26 family signal peptidase [Streptomyces sp. NPDC057617]|uniref:peptidase S26 family protein n=1 Tax=Streptomyces sp. NPDC057617 TaxID=3346184 RepID=UPI00367F51D4
MIGTWVAGACAVALSLGAGYRMLTRRLIVVTVRGLSMLPTYNPGDRVLVRRGTEPARGEVVVVESPAAMRSSGDTGDRWLIKRAVAVAGDRVDEESRAGVRGEIVPPGMLFLLGDNRKLSMDSRQIGYFSTRQLLGTVWFRL